MISVIVCNQKGKWLDWCLWTAIWQKHDDFEVIVVDYGMKPPLPERKGDVLEFCLQDTKTRAIRWEAEEWNHAIARNIGIAHSQGDLLCFVNSDCLMAPDMLTEAEKVWRENPQRQVFWRRFETTPRGVTEIENTAYWHGLFTGGLNSPKLGVLGREGTYGDFCLVAREPVMALGGFDERCAGWGNYDSDLAARLERHGHPIWWGQTLKLIHLHHEPQPNIKADWQRNIDACSSDWLAGRDVRNEGLETFEKY